MPLPAQKIWQIGSFDPAVRSLVALELWASWPIPTLSRRELGYLFFYHAAFGPPPAKAFKLWPPSWKSWVAAKDGKVEDVVRVQPKEVGLAVPEKEPFATHAWPEHLTMEESDRKRAKLLAAYDRVVPLWQSRDPLTPAERQEATNFCKLFKELTPPPLMPCYYALAPDFFVFACDTPV
jgi:hypothetical protein